MQRTCLDTLCHYRPFIYFAKLINHTLQTDNDRNLKIKLLGCMDNALGNHITAHDTTENIHQNTAYLIERERKEKIF